jgi:hypothetical protein
MKVSNWCENVPVSWGLRNIVRVEKRKRCCGHSLKRKLGGKMAFASCFMTSVYNSGCGQYFKMHVGKTRFSEDQRVVFKHFC